MCEIYACLRRENENLGVFDGKIVIEHCPKLEKIPDYMLLVFADSTGYFGESASAHGFDHYCFFRISSAWGRLFQLDFGIDTKSKEVKELDVLFTQVLNSQRDNIASVVSDPNDFTVTMLTIIKELVRQLPRTETVAQIQKDSKDGIPYSNLVREGIPVPEGFKRIVEVCNAFREREVKRVSTKLEQLQNRPSIN